MRRGSAAASGLRRLEVRWVNDRGIAGRGSDGRATELVGATSHTTLRKTAEQDLQRAHHDTLAAIEQQRASP